jgi:hypothetical protein
VLVEADEAAVQRVRRVVDRQLVGDAVERELALRDAVRVAARDAAEVRALGDVVGEVVEPERDVLEVVAPVGDADRLDDPAVGHDLDLHPVRVRQGVEVDGPFRGAPERRFRDRRRRVARRGRDRPRREDGDREEKEDGRGESHDPAPPRLEDVGHGRSSVRSVISPLPVVG